MTSSILGTARIAQHEKNASDNKQEHDDAAAAEAMNTVTCTVLDHDLFIPYEIP